MKRLFTFSALTALLFALELAAFMSGSVVAAEMDTEGWAFFAASCLSHGATLAVLPATVALVLAGVAAAAVLLTRRLRSGSPRRTAGAWPSLAGRMLAVAPALAAVVAVLLLLDMQVFAIYRFHINGFVLNMLTGPGATDIFTFDTLLYLKEGALLLAAAAAAVALWPLAGWLLRRMGSCHAKAVLVAVVCATLYAHLSHVYGAFLGHSSVTRSATLLPYYFPTTASGLMTSLGFHEPAGAGLRLRSASGDIQYPLARLQTHRPDSLPDIVLILVDSWNRRTLTDGTMPRAQKFASQNVCYANHLSASNGTRSAVFGLMFGLTSYYWESFDAAGVSPVFIDRLIELGYDIRTYPSATLENPNFRRVIFRRAKSVAVETPGQTPFDRDTTLAANFIRDNSGTARSRRPRFSFLFFDLPHSFSLPRERNTTFRPAWQYADYTRLSRDLDPTPFYNLYRNCCREDDRLLGRILDCLEAGGAMGRTIVVLTGDHSQEFNENHKNYWGHNSNFSVHQTGVPLIVHWPGCKPATLHHRTTHYDIVPTLLHRTLGVDSPDSLYSMGSDLDDPTPRTWHIVGSNLNYAFIVGGDTILEKTADGSLQVWDPSMNAVGNYHLNPKAFEKAVGKLNKFFKAGK